MYIYIFSCTFYTQLKSVPGMIPIKRNTPAPAPGTEPTFQNDMRKTFSPTYNPTGAPQASTPHAATSTKR